MFAVTSLSVFLFRVNRIHIYYLLKYFATKNLNLNLDLKYLLLEIYVLYHANTGCNTNSCSRFVYAKSIGLVKTMMRRRMHDC